jgi:hypothetical protein
MQFEQAVSVVALVGVDWNTIERMLFPEFRRIIFEPAEPPLINRNPWRQQLEIDSHNVVGEHQADR